jgi:hypothetical protein
MIHQTIPRQRALAPSALALLFCLAAVCLAACGQVSQPAGRNAQGTAGAQATATAASGAQGTAQGTIAGEVVAGPTCPVEPVDTPCPAKPVPHRELTVTAPPNTVVATVTTDDAGRFRVQVPPGNYIVHVKTGPGVGMRQVSSGAVTVRANQTSDLRIELDTLMQ